MIYTVPFGVPETPVGKLPSVKAILVASFPVYVIVVIAVFTVTVWLAAPPVWVIVGTGLMVTATEAWPLSQPAVDVVTA
jgi:hypothetical protein